MQLKHQQLKIARSTIKTVHIIQAEDIEADTLLGEQALLTLTNHVPVDPRLRKISIMLTVEVLEVKGGHLQ